MDLEAVKTSSGPHAPREERSSRCNDTAATLNTYTLNVVVGLNHLVSDLHH